MEFRSKRFSRLKKKLEAQGNGGEDGAEIEPVTPTTDGDAKKGKKQIAKRTPTKTTPTKTTPNKTTPTKKRKLEEEAEQPEEDAADAQLEVKAEEQVCRASVLSWA